VDRVSRWTTKQPLHLTATSSSSSSPSSPPTPLPTSAPPSSTTLAPLTEPKATFTTALAMLLYNVCYLAHTQSVEIPLSQAGDALGNLWAVCCSGELGRYVIHVRVSSRLTARVRRSHETTPSLPPPTSPSFPLDFAQVLQATTASPAKGRRRVATRDAMAGAGPDRSTSGVWPPTRRRPERIAEEDGWEVVEDDGGNGGLG
jgi:hypothetical protein